MDKQVSQKIVGIQISGNDTAQNIPARFAVRLPKHLRATMHDQQHGLTLNRSCITITAIAAAKVKRPEDAEEEGDHCRVTRSQQGSRSCRSTEGRAKAVPRHQGLRQCPQLNAAGVEPVMRKLLDYEP